MMLRILIIKLTDSVATSLNQTMQISLNRCFVANVVNPLHGRQISGSVRKFIEAFMCTNVMCAANHLFF